MSEAGKIGGDAGSLAIAQLTITQRGTKRVQGGIEPDARMSKVNAHTVFVSEDGDVTILDQSFQQQDTTIQRLSNTVQVRQLITAQRRPAGSPSLAGMTQAEVAGAPLHLQPLGTRCLSTNETSVRYNATHSEVLCGGKYLLFYDPEVKFPVAYKIKNDDSTPIPPNAWRQIDIHSYPTDLSTAAAEVLKKGANEYTPSRSSCFATVNNSGFALKDKSNPGGQALYVDANTHNISDNVVVDAKDPNIFYYCSSSNTPARQLVRVDMTDAKKPQVVRIPFPAPYTTIRHLQMSPGGTFFAIETEHGCAFLDPASLHQIGKIDGARNTSFEGETEVTVIEKGSVSSYDIDSTQFAASAARRRLAAAVLQRGAPGITQSPTSDIRTDVVSSERRNVESIVRGQINALAASTGDSQQRLEAAKQLKGTMASVRLQLATDLLTQDEIRAVMSDLEQEAREHETKITEAYFRAVIGPIYERLMRDQSPLGPGEISHFMKTLTDFVTCGLAMAPNVISAGGKVRTTLEGRIASQFEKDAGNIEGELTRLTKAVERELKDLTDLNLFTLWHESRYAATISRITLMNATTPAEAEKVLTTIRRAQQEIQRMVDRTLADLQGRQRASESAQEKRTREEGDSIRRTVDIFLNVLKTKKFSDRKAAEHYVAGDAAHQSIMDAIGAYGKRDKNAAHELQRHLQSAIQIVLGDIDRAGSDLQRDGKRYVRFGKELFVQNDPIAPKSEEKIAVDITFVPSTTASGMFDIMVIRTREDGTRTMSRVYEGDAHEYEVALGESGSKTYENYGKKYQSCITKEEFLDVRNDWNSWRSGKLKREYLEKRGRLLEAYKARRDGLRNKTLERGSVAYDAARRTSAEALRAYEEFMIKHRVPLLQRIESFTHSEDNQKKGPSVGEIPSWRSDWVVDEDTSKGLEKIAERFNAQLENGEGILNVYGHPGTGKDVLLQMFASRTNRPYFTTDCSRWTTEFELSEDLTLVVIDGASATVAIPSALLRGIQTPNAIVYLNEFNAMTNEAQLFLHSLFDGKRSMHPKTRPGQTIKAAPGVVFACSMNPDYPGTTKLQAATLTRLQSMEVKYTPVTIPAEQGDKTRNDRYSPAEAWRIARKVRSLESLTMEQDPTKSPFVIAWNKEVNGVKPAQEVPLTPEQRYDMEVIMALVQLSGKLREHFVNQFSKETQIKKGALPLTHPITMRQLGVCAWALSRIPYDLKMKVPFDQTARALIEEYYLSSLFNEHDRAKVVNELKRMPTSKRII